VNILIRALWHSWWSVALQHVNFAKCRAAVWLIKTLKAGLYNSVTHVQRDEEIVWFAPDTSSRLFQGCTNIGHRSPGQTIKFCPVGPCVSSVWNWLRVTILAGRILRWNPDFRQVCAPLVYFDTRLLKMFVGVLTACHTQYTWDRSICVFLINRTTLQAFVTYLTDALYVHSLWFCKHQHDNRVCSNLYVACQRWRFQWRFAAILVNCAPSG